jgi:uncharacterized membrane-anchored protein YhcB (DUF1043 family)
VISFTLTEWAILALIFVLGLLIGMFLMAGGKWKTRYREEVRRREALEKERTSWESDRKHMEAQRLAAGARSDRPLP